MIVSQASWIINYTRGCTTSTLISYLYSVEEPCLSRWWSKGVNYMSLRCFFFFSFKALGCWRFGKVLEIWQGEYIVYESFDTILTCLKAMHSALWKQLQDKRQENVLDLNTPEGYQRSTNMSRYWSRTCGSMGGWSLSNCSDVSELRSKLKMPQTNQDN